ncbi:MAG: AtpZ/AtpI family protein [Acidobacteriota bacterium]
MSGAPGPGDDPGARRYFADVLTFGWVLPASIAAGAGLGWILDKVFGLFPVLTAALALVGLGAGLRQIYRESGVLSRSGKGPGSGNA